VAPSSGRPGCRPSGAAGPAVSVSAAVGAPEWRIRSSCRLRRRSAALSPSAWGPPAPAPRLVSLMPFLLMPDAAALVGAVRCAQADGRPWRCGVARRIGWSGALGNGGKVVARGSAGLVLKGVRPAGTCPARSHPEGDVDAASALLGRVDALRAERQRVTVRGLPRRTGSAPDIAASESSRLHALQTLCGNPGSRTSVRSRRAYGHRGPLALGVREAARSAGGTRAGSPRCRARPPCREQRAVEIAASRHWRDAGRVSPVAGRLRATRRSSWTPQLWTR
jgi:hypothetical protein